MTRVIPRLIAAAMLYLNGSPLVFAAEIPFCSFVNWDYHHRKPLEGAHYSALAIRETLREWKCASRAGAEVENAGPEAFGPWINRMPHGSLVYMASHQSPAADWDFTQRKLVSLAELLPGDHPADPDRIVILDACYAETARRVPGWNRFAASALMAGKESEETFQLEMFMRRPVDFETRYPAEYHWLKQHLPSAWNGKITFLGLLWVRAFMTTLVVPQDRAAWRVFFGKIADSAAEFRAKRSSKLASMPVFYLAPPGETGL